MPEWTVGLLDTSALINLENLNEADLPDVIVVSALSLAELAAGPHATPDPIERSRRQDRLQRAEALFNPVPFDTEAARAYGEVYAATLAAGRKARGNRAIDLMIAATARATRLPLYTCNPSDLGVVQGLFQIVGLRTVPR